MARTAQELTTQELRQAVLRISHRIAEIEANGPPRKEWNWVLDRLRDKRKALNLVILYRRIEGRKKIVSLQRWRDGPWTREDRR